MNSKRVLRPVILYSLGLLITAGSVLLLAGCMDPMSGTAAGASNPAVSVLNVPSNATNLEISITGSGMDEIRLQPTPGQSTVSVFVPQGPNRRFSLSADLFEYGTTTVNPSVWYDGVVTRSITPSSSVVGIPASLRSVIMVPFLDTAGNEARLFADATPLTSLGSFGIDNETLAIDFDHLGRIYLGRNRGSGTLIQRRNSAVSGGISIFLQVGGAIPSGNRGIVAMAIDRPRRWVYHAEDGRIWRTRYDNSDNAAQPADTEELTGSITFPNGLNPGLGSRITGIAVDQADGTILIAQQRQVFRFDSVTSQVLSVFPNEGILAPEDQITDVRIRGQHVLVLFHDSLNFAPVVELNRSLSFVRAYGTFVAPGTAGQDEFNRPALDLGVFRFVAVLNRRIGILETGTNNARLVVIDDLSGAGWDSESLFGSDVNFPMYPVLSQS